MVLAAAWSDCLRLETLVVVTVEALEPTEELPGEEWSEAVPFRVPPTPSPPLAADTLVPPDPVTALFMVMEDGE